MPVQRQTLNIPFAQGLDTKNDPWQIQPGNFLVLENALFQQVQLHLIDGKPDPWTM